MYIAESEALAATATAAVANQVNGDAPDGKFEDYVAAGARMADLVTAESRAASNVAVAILSLCGSAGGIQRGLSFAGGACGANGGDGASYPAGPASLVPYLAYGAGCDGSSTTAGGRGGGGGFAAGAGGKGESANGGGEVDENRAAQLADWKPKRGRP